MPNIRILHNQGSLLYLLTRWVYRQVRIKKLNTPFGYTVFIILALGLSFTIAWLGTPYCYLFLGGLIGIAIIIACIANTKFGFYFTIFYCFFVFLIKRLLFPFDPPLGSISEILIFATFLGIMLKKIVHREKGWSHSKNAITYIYLIYLVYMGVEVLNTYGGSMEGWFFVYRKFFELFIFYFISLHIFSDMASIKYFVKFWLVMALISALYACYQEWVKMPAFEIHFITSDPALFGLYFQAGEFRKYGTLSDPMSFGILMSVSAIFSIILALGPFKKRFRIMLVIGSFIMILAMGYSGTRTATAIIPASILLFGLMTINNRKSLLFICGFLMIGSVLIFGPFYGNSTINRMRTAFNGDQDASMNIRDVHRKQIQPFMHTHPFGSGLATTGVLGMQYNPWNPLARFPPDSSYLRLALELGPVGLALTLFLYFILLKIGINAYYSSRDPKIRYFIVASVAAIFAWTIAQYSQEAVGQIPGALTFYPLLAAIIKMREFDKNSGNGLNLPTEKPKLSSP